MKSVIPKCSLCQVDFCAATETQIGFDQDIRIKIWECEKCGQIKVVSTKQDLKLWDKAKKIRAVSKSEKVEFKSLKKNPNAVRGIPKDYGPQRESCESSGGCGDKCGGCNH